MEQKQTPRTLVRTAIKNITEKSETPLLERNDPKEDYKTPAPRLSETSTNLSSLSIKPLDLDTTVQSSDGKPLSTNNSYFQTPRSLLVQALNVLPQVTPSPVQPLDPRYSFLRGSLNQSSLNNSNNSLYQTPQESLKVAKESYFDISSFSPYIPKVTEDDEKNIIESRKRVELKIEQERQRLLEEQQRNQSPMPPSKTLQNRLSMTPEPPNLQENESILLSISDSDKLTMNKSDIDKSTINKSNIDKSTINEIITDTSDINKDNIQNQSHTSIFEIPQLDSSSIHSHNENENENSMNIDTSSSITNNKNNNSSINNTDAHISNQIDTPLVTSSIQSSRISDISNAVPFENSVDFMNETIRESLSNIKTDLLNTKDNLLKTETIQSTSLLSSNPVSNTLIHKNSSEIKENTITIYEDSNEHNLNENEHNLNENELILNENELISNENQSNLLNTNENKENIDTMNTTDSTFVHSRSNSLVNHSTIVSSSSSIPPLSMITTTENQNQSLSHVSELHTSEGQSLPQLEDLPLSHQSLNSILNASKTSAVNQSEYNDVSLHSIPDMNVSTNIHREENKSLLEDKNKIMSPQNMSSNNSNQISLNNITTRDNFGALSNNSVSLLSTSLNKENSSKDSLLSNIEAAQTSSVINNQEESDSLLNTSMNVPFEMNTSFPSVVNDIQESEAETNVSKQNNLFSLLMENTNTNPTLSTIPSTILQSKSQFLPENSPIKRKRTPINMEELKNRPILPESFTKQLFTSFSRKRLSKHCIPAINDITKQFFESISDSISLYAQHAHRRTIELSDIEILFKRQRLIDSNNTFSDIVYSTLPQEQINDLLPLPKSK